MPNPLDQKYCRWRWQTFAITWLAYAGFYLTRKGFSAAKVALGPGTAIDLSKGQMAAIDTAYNVAYMIGQFIFGVGGDRVGTRRVILIGMFLSILAGAAMGFSRTALMFGIIFSIQGLVQATGWGPLMKNVSSFFSQRERGMVLGLWCTNYSLGGFLATVLAGRMGEQYGWQWAFWAPAGLLLVIWILFLLFQRNRPEDVGLPPIDQYHGDAPPPAVTSSAASVMTAPGPIKTSWREIGDVIMNPVVMMLCFVYFCLKPARYLFMFWGPQYMHEKLGTGIAASALVGSAFELGGPVGALLAGWISDKCFSSRRMPVAVLSLLGLGVMIFFFHQLPAQAWVIAGCFAVMGAFTYAADSLVNATAAVDFGTQRGAATATGVINGCGSAGQIFGAALPGIVPLAWGWDNIFAILAGAVIFAGLVLLPKWNAMPPPAKAANA